MTSPTIPESASPVSQAGENADSLKQQSLIMHTRTGEPQTLQPDRKRRPRETWLTRLVLVTVLLLAATPPALVVAQQWLGILPGDWKRETWCRFEFLCLTILPSYFLIILGCFFALLVLMLFVGRKPVVIVEHALAPFSELTVTPRQKEIGLSLVVVSGWSLAGVIFMSQIKQHYPGWDLVLVWVIYLAGWGLRAVSFEFLLNQWEKKGEYWVSLMLAHIALVIVLAAYYDVTQIFYGSLILLVLALGNLWRFRKRIPAIYWVISITLVFYTININSWRTSIIGDDYNFHDLAWQFAEKMSLTQVGEVLFKADGAHGTHPYFSSFVQGISMKLLGHDSFGWRFSNLYLSAIGVGLFYFFCKSFIAKHEALMAACLLAFSHYVMSFGKIGYNNLQALFALTLALAITAWTLRWKQPLAFALLGSALALCFYLYPASLYVTPVPLLLLLIYYPPVSRPALGRWLVMIIPFAAMIYPLLMQPIYWETKLAGTLFFRPDLYQSMAVVAQHFAQNLFYAILSIFYIAEGHYIAVAFIDPVSAIFVFIGYFVLLYQIRRTRFAVFTGLFFVLFLFTVGASHDRETPPSTRMFLLLPLFALLGMWGMLWVEQQVKKASPFEWNTKKNVLMPALLVLVAVTNLMQAYLISPMRFGPTQSAESLFIGITQSIQKAEPNSPKNFAVILGDTWGTSGLVEFQNVYPHLAWFQIYTIQINGPVLPGGDLKLLSERDTLIMVSPYIDPEWQTALDAPLLALGKTRCIVSTPDGQKRFVLYYAPDMPSACPKW